MIQTLSEVIQLFKGLYFSVAAGIYDIIRQWQTVQRT